MALWVGGLPGFGQLGVLLLAGGGAPLFSCLNKTDLCSLPAPGLQEGLVLLMQSRGCSGRRALESDRGHLCDCPLPYPPPLALLPAPFLLPFPLPPGVVAEGRCALRLLLLAAARMVQGRFAGEAGYSEVCRTPRLHPEAMHVVTSKECFYVRVENFSTSTLLVNLLSLDE